MTAERLQKVLAASGVASRRASEVLIANGRVTVDGKIAAIGAKVDPERSIIAVDGRVIGGAAPAAYLLLNKPAGVTSTVRDRHASRTVLDMLPTALVPEGARLYPVGRLDYESEGLLLLMNDGDLAARLTHPSHGIARVYEATVLGVPDANELERLQRGMVIDGRRMRASEVALLPMKRDAAGATLVITLREGRNRQVRNMCDAIGHPVDHLKRVAIGPLRDARLKVGYWRDLSEEEVKRLSKAGEAPATAAPAPIVPPSLPPNRRPRFASSGRASSLAPKSRG
jgi:pseudouridine synthase